MLITYLQKVSRLTKHNQMLLIQACLLLPVIHGGLVLVGYARLKRGMGRLVSRKTKTSFLSEKELFQQAQEIAYIVSIASKYVLSDSSTCLRSSLLTWWFLECEGINSDICFGVRWINSQLDAHSWVEYQKRVVNDPAEICTNFYKLESKLPETGLGINN